MGVKPVVSTLILFYWHVGRKGEDGPAIRVLIASQRQFNIQFVFSISEIKHHPQIVVQFLFICFNFLQLFLKCL